MIVPLIPVSSDHDGRLSCGKLSFKGSVPEIVGPTEDYLERISAMGSSAEDKRPVVIMDVKGLRRGNMDNVLLKNLKIRGSKIWFMTQIETADDVLDAFNTDADAVLMPFGTVMDTFEMGSIMEISDSVIPVVIVSKRRTDSYLGRTEVLSALRELERFGYRRSIVMDTDGGFELRDWKELSVYDIVPYSERIGDEEFASIGFDNVLRCLP